MVRKTIISGLLILFIQACSEKRPAFFREHEVLGVMKELKFDVKEPTLLLVVRTNRCDLCTDAARELFNQTPYPMLALMDDKDSGFHSGTGLSGKSVMIKPMLFFESRGIDFSENYLFVINRGKIRNFYIVSRETKEKIKNGLESEMN